jgi:hypothetical protein
MAFLAMRRLTSLPDKHQLCHYLVLNRLLQYLGVHRHGKLIIGTPCKKRADDLLKLSTHQLKMVVAILIGHAPVRRHLHIMDLFEGDPTCRFCRKETETVQHIICCCKALTHQHYNIFGNPFVKPNLSKGPLPLHKRHRVTESVLNGVFRVAQ